VELAEEHCAHWPSGMTERPTQEAVPAGGLAVMTKESSNQEHVAQMTPAPTSQSDLRFAADILSVIVGDDANSRLYWELIEPGHAEAAELSYNEYDGSGTYMTFLTCHPDDVEKNMAVMARIFEDVNKNGVTSEELEQAKNKVASRIVLRSERPMGRLSSLGSNWVYRQEYRSVEDDLNTLQSLTLDDINALLKAYPLGHTTTVAIGPRESITLNS
ncbi:MAG TPA: insulinase family protein, partial [Planctomycetaceae bacterium]|nr:insulinase family protein [Planctomycetaceae bacterium]